MIHLIYVGDPTQFHLLCGSTHTESDGARQPNVDSGSSQPSGTQSLRRSSAPGQWAVSEFRRGCTLQGSARRTPPLGIISISLYRLRAVRRLQLSQSLHYRHCQMPMSAPLPRRWLLKQVGIPHLPQEILRVLLLQPRRFLPLSGLKANETDKSLPKLAVLHAGSL
jgi:hypothetical protein